MNDCFTIYTERLHSGKSEKLSLETSPDFIKVNEEELQFKETVTVEGQAYIAEKHLVIHVDINTTCEIPCSLCNVNFSYPIALEGQYYTIPLEEIPKRHYDYSENIRSSILLEVPQYARCQKKDCAEKGGVKQFLKHEHEEIHYPFADL